MPKSKSRSDLAFRIGTGAFGFVLIALVCGISSASTEEYSVPQMNGSAPNSPATGSQISVRQKLSPNF